jgi:hypothetical protein
MWWLMRQLQLHDPFRNRVVQKANVILMQVCALAFARKQSSSQVTWHQPTSLASSPFHPSMYLFFPSSNPGYPSIYSMELSPSWEAASRSATQEFPNTRRFINVLTTVRHWFLSSARLIHLTHSHPILQKSILLPFSHLLDVSSFRISYHIFTILFYTCYMPCPSHSPQLPVLLVFGEENKLWAPHYAFFSFLRYHTLFLNTFSLCCSLNARD